MLVAVLGCGPAGLLAAHAIRLEGHEVRIYAVTPQPSMISGAIYVHEAIPNLTPEEPDATISYSKEGTREGYAAKVYGSPDAPCSWDKFPEGLVPAWSMGKMYATLWKRWGLKVREVYVDNSVLPEIIRLHDVVISTIPPYAYCQDPEHDFHKKQVWITPVVQVDEQQRDPFIIYNGDPDVSYYRTSLLFGEGSTEYGSDAAPGVGLYRPWMGFKPLQTTCDCFPEVYRAGRFGQWKKGVLSHEAYSIAKEAVSVAV